MQKNLFILHHKNHWEGQILGVHISIDLVKRPKARLRKFLPPNTVSIIRMGCYERDYFVVRSPHETFELPARIKSIKRAKHWVRESILHSQGVPALPELI